MTDTPEGTFGKRGRARKRSVEIEYARWTGDQRAMHRFMPGVRLALAQYAPGVHVPDLLIPTLEGEMAAREGDYIIKGVQGEFYPCKPAIFEATYVPV